MSVMGKARSLLLLPLTLVAMLATGCSLTSATVVVATGGVTCTNMTGMLSFSPPLKTNGDEAESIAISLMATRCTTSGSNISSVTGAETYTTILSPSNACSGILTLRPFTTKVIWNPETIGPSVVHFSEYSFSSDRSGSEVFTLPNPGGTARVTGSFAGSDKGAGSTATAYLGRTLKQLLTACSTNLGLALVPVASGRVTLK